MGTSIIGVTGSGSAGQRAATPGLPSSTSSATADRLRQLQALRDAERAAAEAAKQAEKDAKQAAEDRAREASRGLKEPSAATQFWASLSPSARRTVKQQMWWAGLYGDTDPPALGSSMLTPYDMGALESLLAVAEPNGGIVGAATVLEEMAAAGQQQGIPLGRTPEDPTKAYEDALAKALQEKYDKTNRVKMGVEAENILRQYTHAQGLQFNDDSYKKWASDIVSMDTTVEEVQRGLLNNYVMNSFPAWRKELEAGATVKDLASPYAATMARILEVPETDIDLYDPHIKRVMQGSGTEEKVPLWQFEQQLMADPRWERTSNAKSAASNIASMLSNTFGVNA